MGIAFGVVAIVLCLAATYDADSSSKTYAELELSEAVLCVAFLAVSVALLWH